MFFGLHIFGDVGVTAADFCFNGLDWDLNPGRLCGMCNTNHYAMEDS